MILYEILEPLANNQSIVIVNGFNDRWYGDKESYFEQDELYFWWYKVEEIYSTDEDSIWIHVKSQEKQLEDIKKRKIEEFEDMYYTYLRDFKELSIPYADKKDVILKNIEFLNKLLK